MDEKVQPINVTVTPYGDGCFGNVIWCERNRGSAESIKKFRALGYWASCFPEGDGMAYEPLNGQDYEQCVADVKISFGWDVKALAALQEENDG